MTNASPRPEPSSNRWLDSEHLTLPNLFDGAPRELSHSAYLAWLLRLAALRDAPQEFAAAQQAGLAFWELLTGGRRGPPSRVATEVPVGSVMNGRPRVKQPKLRLDVVAWDEKDRAVVLETKVSGRQRRQQLVEYKGLVCDSSEHLFIPISLAYSFDPQWVRRFEVCEQGVGLSDFLEVMEPFRGAHPIIEHHVGWLERERSLVQQLQRHLSSGDLPDVAQLADETGLTVRKIERRLQWAFMQLIVGALPRGEAGRGAIYNGSNNGGTPWTQYRFVFEGHEDAREAAILRFDSKGLADGKPERRLALELYTAKSATPAHLRRAQAMAEAWDHIARRSPLLAHERKPRLRLAKERRIVEFNVSAETLGLLLLEIPALHRALRLAVGAL